MKKSILSLLFLLLIASCNTLTDKSRNIASTDNKLSNILMPLVQDHGYGNINYNDMVREKIFPNLLVLNEYSYQVGRFKYIKVALLDEYLKKSKWTTREIAGITGMISDERYDVPAFVSHNDDLNTIVVTFRGTQVNIIDEIENRGTFAFKFKDIAAGWQANFDFEAQTINQMKLYMKEQKKQLQFKLRDYNGPKEKLTKKQRNEFEKIYNSISGIKKGLQEANRLQSQKVLPNFIEMHRGYLYRIIRMREAIEDEVMKIYNSLSLQKQKQLQIVFTGHSQGGGLGTIAAPIMIKSLAKKMFSDESSKFDNKIYNKFKAHFLSSPRVWHGQESRDWAESVIGKNNIVRQNVIKNRLFPDPVTISGLGPSAHKFLMHLGFYSLAKKYADFQDIGYLAGDYDIDVITRNAAYSRNDMSERSAEFIKKNGYTFFNRIKVHLNLITNYLSSIHYGSQTRIIKEGNHPDWQLFCISCADTNAELDQINIYGDKYIYFKANPKKERMEKEILKRLNRPVNTNMSLIEKIESSGLFHVRTNILPVMKLEELRYRFKKTGTLKTLDDLLKQGHKYNQSWITKIEDQ